MTKQLTFQDKLHAAKVKDTMIRRADMHVEIVKKMPDLTNSSKRSLKIVC